MRDKCLWWQRKKEEKPPRLPAETKSGPLKALSRILSPPNPNRVSPARSTQALTTTSKPFLLLQFLYLSLSSLLFLSLCSSSCRLSAVTPSRLSRMLLLCSDGDTPELPVPTLRLSLTFASTRTLRCSSRDSLESRERRWSLF